MADIISFWQTGSMCLTLSHSRSDLSCMFCAVCLLVFDRRATEKVPGLLISRTVYPPQSKAYHMSCSSQYESASSKYITSMFTCPVSG